MTVMSWPQVMLVFALVGILSIGLSNQAFAQSQWSVYIEPLPEGINFDVDKMLQASSDYWQQRDGSSFYRTNDEIQSNVAIYWVKNFGKDLLGHATGLAEQGANIELGIGDEFCGKVWHQYSDNYFIETMIHELGHTLGYGHVDDPSDIMYFQGTNSEYAIESHERTSIPGYSYYIPACTLKDSTQYQYEVSVDDNAFRFNTYFVSSYQEFEKHVDGKDIQIYQNCVKENTNYVKDFCNVGYGSGLIVSLIDGPQNQLAQISINLKEVSAGTGVVTQTPPDTGIVKEPPSKGPPSYSPDIPEDTFISNDWITLEQKIFSLTETISPTIILEGNVKQFGTSSTQQLFLFIIKPDGTYEQLQLLVSNSGAFSTSWLLKSDSPPGQYQITGKYNRLDLPPIFFTVLDSSTQDPSKVFSVGPKTESMTVWEMNDFFINYPSNWSVETNYETEIEGEPGLLSIVDDINFWNVQVNINYFQDELIDYVVNDPVYLTDLIQLYSDDCSTGQESLDKFGYFCSNFSVIDSKTFSLNGIKAHQISYSWRETYPDRTYYDNITIITEIPEGEDVWNIYAETYSSSYSSFLPVIDDVISTFVLKSVSAQPANISSLPSITQQTGIFVNTDKASYSEGDEIVISGQVEPLSSLPTVTIRITAPNGNLVRIDQPTIDSAGNFETSFRTGGTMKQTGSYTIEMMYGSDSAATVFEFDAVTQPTPTPTPTPTPIPPISPPQIEEPIDIPEELIDYVYTALWLFIIFGIPIIVIALIVRGVRKRRRSSQAKVEEPKVEQKPRASKLPIISRTWEISSRADPSNINTVSVGINYTNAFVDSTWHTGGLHDIKDGTSYGEYCLTLNQSSPQSRIIGTFELSLPLYGWKHSEDEGLHVYEMRGPSATLDESKLFFSKACNNFETELSKLGYNVRLL